MFWLSEGRAHRWLNRAILAGGREEGADGILVGHRGSRSGKLAGRDVSVLMDGFDHEGADGNLLVKVREDPAGASDGCRSLVEGQVTAGVDAGQHSP